MYELFADRSVKTVRFFEYLKQTYTESETLSNSITSKLSNTVTIFEVDEDCI